MKDLKGKGGCNHSPLSAGLLTARFFFFNAILFTQLVHEITEGEAREEIWSFVNYLFFMSTSLIFGKKQQIRQGIM